VVGLQGYGVNLKDMAKIMSKRFACSAAVTTEDKYGECIQLQGDIEERFKEFYEAELNKFNIPEDKIKFEEVKKKKAEGEE
jgi:translation initiation factor 1 (eIF-1/SUI1)